MIEDLRRPRAYPAPHADEVRVVETHISWVFLVGEAAYKVKKPIDLGFLDFRTLEKRRDACAAEVALNTRLAPNVYLGVVAIRAHDRLGYHVGDTGEVVDWAVHMRRLPEARRADVLLASGKLTARDIDRVAERLARFHANARADADTARFGQVAVIRGNVTENFSQARSSIAQHITPQEARQIEGSQLGFLEKRPNVFAARMAAGCIVDGHGDLRLEHVYLDVGEEGVTVLDCVEFNERFRFADVCADIAFLSMDLAWHGRVDLAERLLAHYAREANDYDLYTVVDFYEEYRAYVRAKIAAMLANDELRDSAARARAAADARRYFLLAMSGDRRSLLEPSVVAVGGVIAAGKSTVADILGAKMSAPVIDADRTRKHLLGVAPTRKLDDGAWQGAYAPSMTEDVYSEVLRRAGVVLASGRPVVLDASFRSVELRRAARALAAAHGVPFRFVECRAPDDVCRARLAKREEGASVSDGRRAIFEDFRARFEAVVELSAAEHVVFDTSDRRALVTLEARIATWPEEFVA